MKNHLRLQKFMSIAIVLGLSACGRAQDENKSDGVRANNFDPNAPECPVSLQKELTVFAKNWDGLENTAAGRNAAGSFKLLMALKKQCDRMDRNFDNSVFDCNMKFNGQPETVTYEGVEEKCSTVYENLEALN